MCNGCLILGLLGNTDLAPRMYCMYHNCSAQYYTVMYYTVLFLYTVLYGDVKYCTVLYCTLLYCMYQNVDN